MLTKFLTAVGVNLLISDSDGNNEFRISVAILQQHKERRVPYNGCFTSNFQYLHAKWENKIKQTHCNFEQEKGDSKWMVDFTGKIINQDRPIVLAAASLYSYVVSSQDTSVYDEYDRHLLLILKRNITGTMWKSCWAGYASKTNPTPTNLRKLKSRMQPINELLPQNGQIIQENPLRKC